MKWIKRYLRRRQGRAFRWRNTATLHCETLEGRCLLSANPIYLGAVYTEQTSQGTETTGDLFQITWNGGGHDAQLTQLVIDGDQDGNGFDQGDVFFDTVVGGPGVGTAFPVQIISADGIDSVSFTVVDGGTRLVIQATGWDAGETLVFSVDVDEQDDTANSLVEGAEFERSVLEATFVSAGGYYESVTGTARFYDDYDALIHPSLPLPRDSDYPPGEGTSARTAGAGLSLDQPPLPVQISGRVYQDLNLNNAYDPGEPLLAGVQLELQVWNGSGYVSTGLVQTTNGLGQYSFSYDTPGRFRVVETQPAGYLSVSANPGNIDGTPEGLASGTDIIEEIDLLGGQHSRENNFGEALPARITGSVFEDLDDDGLRDPGEPGIAGVEIQLLDASGNPTGITTLTDADGQFAFTNLFPGTYGLQELQPTGYLDGKDRAGTAGGTVDNPGDRITLISLGQGEAGLDYTFGELRGASISGYVFQDGPPVQLEQGTTPDPDVLVTLRTGTRTPDDTPIAGVVLRLLDSSGNPVLGPGGVPLEVSTNGAGYYEFTGLLPGTYTVVQVHPSGWYDGVDTPGTTGGVADNPGDQISQIRVLPGQHSQENNFSEIRVEFVPPPDPPPPPVPPEDFVQIVPFDTQITRLQLPRPPQFPPPPLVVFDGLLVYPPAVQPPPFVGGGLGAPQEHTWHLSVIDAGHPRGDRTRGSLASHSSIITRAAATMPHPEEMKQGQWLLLADESQPPKQLQFGMPDSLPVVGDWDGDGLTDLGIFRAGHWFLDVNGNGQWDAEDLWAQLGDKHDLPVTGDWDGDFKTDIGIFGPQWPNDPVALATEPGLPDRDNRNEGKEKNLPPQPQEAPVGFRTMRRVSDSQARADVIDHVFQFGVSHDIPLVGDWNGDGVATIGVFRDGLWKLDDNGDGRWTPEETIVQFGRPGDLPVVGDWDGDGIDDLAVFRAGKWIMDTNGNRTIDPQDKVLQFGRPGDLPVAGDWDGDGTDDPGLYRPGAAPGR